MSLVATAPTVPVSGTAAPGSQVRILSYAGGAWTARATVAVASDGRFAAQLPLGANTLGATTLRAEVSVVAPVGATTPPAVTAVTTRVWPADDVRLTDAQARTLLTSQGLAIYSSGGCSTRTRSVCTSFDTIRTQTVRAVVDTKNRSRCAVTVNGGTETGHADGTYSHWNGYKADLLMSSCLTSYVTANAAPMGWPFWFLPPITFFDETSHWDLTVK